MPHSYTSILTHLVFGTKSRDPLIDAELEPQLNAYIGGIVRNLGGTLIAIDGWFDHRHLLAAHPPTLSVAELARLIKTNSSKWVHETWPSLRGFAWQDGYGGFSVGRGERDRIEAYILNQKEHHRVETFEEEFVRFLEDSGITFDSKYLWKR